MSAAPIVEAAHHRRRFHRILVAQMQGEVLGHMARVQLARLELARSALDHAVVHGHYDVERRAEDMGAAAGHYFAAAERSYDEAFRRLSEALADVGRRRAMVDMMMAASPVRTSQACTCFAGASQQYPAPCAVHGGVR